MEKNIFASMDQDDAQSLITILRRSISIQDIEFCGHLLSLESLWDADLQIKYEGRLCVNKHI